MKKSRYNFRESKAPKKPESRKILIAISLIALILAVVFLLPLMRAVIGLVFVLFLPGYVASIAFFRKDEIDSLERFALSVGLSISLVVLTVMFSNLWLGIPINLLSLVLEISFICAFFAGVIRFRQIPYCMDLWERFFAKATFAHHPQKRPIFAMLTLIGFLTVLLYLDFFMSMSPDPVVSETPASVGRLLMCNSTDYDGSQVSYSFENSEAVDPLDFMITYSIIDDFSGKIAFLGYNLDTGSVSPGGSFRLTYFWKSLDDMRTNYTVFVHITDLDGKILFQQDHDLPLGTSEWSRGDIISESWDIQVPKNLEEGPVLIRIGVYDRSGGSRLPVTCGRFVDPSNSALIGSLTVRKKTFDDYYDNSSKVLYVDTRTGATSYVDSVTVSNPRVIDYGPVVVLGYDVPTLETGWSSYVVYYLKASDFTGRYVLRTLLTDTRGPGIVTVDTPIDFDSTDGLVMLSVPIDIPSDYGAGESVFTFALKDSVTGEYVTGSAGVLEKVTVY